MTATTSSDQNQFALQLEEIKKQEAKIKEQNNFRVFSFSLMEAAMRFREGHWREDIENYAESVRLSTENYKGKRDKGWENRRKKQDKFLVDEYRRKVEGFNTLVYKEIEALQAEMKNRSKEMFDELAAMFGDVILEFYKAKDKSDLFKLCQLYNEGILDNALNFLKAEAQRVLEGKASAEKAICCICNTEIESDPFIHADFDNRPAHLNCAMSNAEGYKKEELLVAAADQILDKVQETAFSDEEVPAADEAKVINIDKDGYVEPPEAPAMPAVDHFEGDNERNEFLAGEPDNTEI